MEKINNYLKYCNSNDEVLLNGLFGKLWCLDLDVILERTGWTAKKLSKLCDKSGLFSREKGKIHKMMKGKEPNIPWFVEKMTNRILIIKMMQEVENPLEKNCIDYTQYLEARQEAIFEGEEIKLMSKNSFQVERNIYQRKFYFYWLERS